jgi:hypothetical protein
MTKSSNGRRATSSRDMSRLHPYLTHVTVENRARIVRSKPDSEPAKWVQIYVNDVLTFSNKPGELKLN